MYNETMDLRFAVLDGEIAVPCNLQSATAGLNSCLRHISFVVCPQQVVLKIGSCAMKTCESGQVRKKAAISEIFHVPQGLLVGANY